jgi:SPASM domain peptide maturase of grasp-with-spasm system
MIYKLYACCIPVKGSKRSVLMDLQRGGFIFIPNDLCDILIENEVIDKDLLQIKYSGSNKSTISEYLDYLLKEEQIFQTNDAVFFPKLNTQFEIPYRLNNCILDYAENSTYNLEKALLKIDNIGCSFCEIRFFCDFNFDYLIRLEKIIEDSKFRSIDILIKYSTKLNLDFLFVFINRFPRIGKILIYNSPKNRFYNSFKKHRIIFKKSKILNESNCGVINPLLFDINNDFYFESLKYNNCLNQKLSIDSNGKIKNCPSFKKDYGNIEIANLETVLLDKNFKEVWKIKKDDVKVCKDCEFRYMCSDCRVYTINNKLFEKPLHCKYNPYEATYSV